MNRALLHPEQYDSLFVGTDACGQLYGPEDGVYERAFNDKNFSTDDDAEVSAAYLEADKLAKVCQDPLLRHFLGKHALYAFEGSSQDTGANLLVRYPTIDTFEEAIAETKQRLPQFSPPGFRAYHGDVYSAEAFAAALVDGYVLTSNGNEMEHDMVSHNPLWLCVEPALFQPLQRRAEDVLTHPGEPNERGDTRVNHFMNRIDTTFEVSPLANLLLDPQATIRPDGVLLRGLRDIFADDIDTGIATIRNIGNYARQLAQDLK